jgi:hypothetical protein
MGAGALHYRLPATDTSERVLRTLSFRGIEQPALHLKVDLADRKSLTGQIVHDVHQEGIECGTDAKPSRSRRYHSR